MQTLDDKVVLITGGTTGIGRESAVTLARAGAQILLTGRRLGRTVAKSPDRLNSHRHSNQEPIRRQDRFRTIEQVYGDIDLS